MINAANQTTGKGKRRYTQRSDVNSKRIFENRILCAQFLREYSGIEMFKNVQPEDIEYIPLRYHIFDEVELQADSVNRIWLQSCGEIADVKDEVWKTPWYIVPLIDHKSKVDYNICMQLLRYMVCIWTDWEKEHEAERKSKEFRYPPILPIVYYEGTACWTADMHLRDRVFMSDVLGEYLPDFTYHVVRLHDYSNEELLRKQNEISLMMLLNKIQRPEDLSVLHELSAEDVNELISSSPQNVVDIIAATVASLCSKMNLPEEEQQAYISKIRERDMGYLFENMEPMDIQAERAKTKAERERFKAEREKVKAEQEKVKAEQEKVKAEQEKVKVEQEKVKAEQEKVKAEQEKVKAEQEKVKAEQEKVKAEQEGRRQEKERANRAMVLAAKNYLEKNTPHDEILSILMSVCDIDKEDAETICEAAKELL